MTASDRTTALLALLAEAGLTMVRHPADLIGRKFVMTVTKPADGEIPADIADLYGNITGLAYAQNANIFLLTLSGAEEGTFTATFSKADGEAEKRWMIEEYGAATPIDDFALLP